MASVPRYDLDEPHAAEMDYPEHEATYRFFRRLVRNTIIAAVVVILLWYFIYLA